MSSSVVNRTDSRRFDTFVLSICLVLAFGLRLAVILNEPQQLTQDRDVYLAIAKGIAAERGYSVPDSSVPTAFRPPLYPLSLAAGLLAFSPPIAVAVVNLIFALLTVWLTAILGASLGLGTNRYVAAFLVAVDPLLVRYSAQPMTETLSALLAVLWLWAMVERSPEFDRRPGLRGLIIGFVFGLLVLSRPTFWLIACLCCVAWFVGRFRKPGNRDTSVVYARAKSLIGTVLGAAIAVAPWLVRNWLVFSVPILTTTHGGYTLLLGNNPVFYREVVQQPWGTVWSGESQREWETEMKSHMERELGPQATEDQADAWQSRSARAYIAQEPRHFMETAVHRVRSLWNTTPTGDTSGASRTVIAATGLFYGIVLIAALVGACLTIRRGDFDRWLPLYILIAAVQLAHLFYWTNTRMRAPLVPAIAIFATAVVSKIHPKTGESST